MEISQFQFTRRVTKLILDVRTFRLLLVLLVLRQIVCQAFFLRRLLHYETCMISVLNKLALGVLYYTDDQRFLLFPFVNKSVNISKSKAWCCVH